MITSNTSISGLASGLDTTALVGAILSVEQRPLFILQDRQAVRTNELTAWRSTETLLLAIQAHASRLASRATFSGALSATSSNEDILSVRAGETAAPGNYSITVDQLAQSHQVASIGYDDRDTTTFGAGTIAIRQGSASSLVTIESGGDTLEGIRDAINNASIGVTASIIDSGESRYNHQLVLTSDSTGVTNALSLELALEGGATDLSFTESGAIGSPSPWSGASSSVVTASDRYYGEIARDYTFEVQNLADSVIKSPDLTGWTGAAPALGGDYSGPKDQTYAVSVTSGGQLGTDEITLNWSATGGDSGSVTIPAGYGGEAIELDSGITLTFPASGNLAGGESFDFDVETGYGLVGSDSNPVILSWTDGLGGSGQIDLGSDYNAGDPVDLHDGLSVRFSAGAVEEGDTFTLSVEPGSEIRTLQAAQDAQVRFGSTSGGATPITVTSATNSITTLIDGVTIDLASADPDTPVTFEVFRDDAAIVSSVQGFVDAYNALNDFLNLQFDYDPVLGAGGVLLGDSSLIQLQNQVRKLVTGSQPHLPADLHRISQAGLTLSTDGSLVLDSAALEKQLRDDFDGIVGLFSEFGDSSDRDVNFVSADASTVANGTGYRVEVTRAATQGIQAGDSLQVSAAEPVIIDIAHDKMRLEIDGRDTGIFQLESGNYESGAELASMVERSLLEGTSFKAGEVQVKWEANPDDPAEGSLVVHSLAWGHESSVRIVGSSSTADGRLGLQDRGTSRGHDVQGRIGGFTAFGQGRTLSATEGDAKGLVVEVSLTGAQLASQGPDQGFVSFTQGMGSRMEALVESMTAETGIVGSRIHSIQSQIDILVDRITDFEARIALREQSLLAEFAAMESAIGLLQSQGNFLSSQLKGLDNLNQAISARSS